MSTIKHPSWCAQNRCTATTAYGPDEWHRSSAVVLSGTNGSGAVVTVALVMNHAAWATATWIEVDLKSGTGEDACQCSALLDVEQARGLGRVLGLSTRIAADRRAG